MAKVTETPKILVIGGAGFIGSHVAERYLKSGWEVAIVDNLFTGKKENIPSKAKFYPIDILDKKKLETVFKEENPSIINHHAAQIDIRTSLKDPGFDASVNVLGTIYLLELAVKYKLKKFIFASTGGALYGEAQQKPSVEEDPVYPFSHYAVSKFCAEQYIRLYSRLYGLSHTILRYGNVYGPRQNPQGEAGVNAIFIHALLSKQTPTIFGDGEQIRDYVYVEDVAEANVKAASGGDGETINIGTGETTTVNQLFSHLKEILRFEGNARFEPKRAGEIFCSRLSVKKAEKILGWKPSVSLGEGLKKTCLWQKELGKKSKVDKG